MGGRPQPVIGSRVCAALPRAAVSILACLYVAPAVLSAQTTPEPTPISAVEGLVLGRFGDVIEPLPGAVVTAIVEESRWDVVADEEGRFRIDDLPVGHVSLTARHPSYQSVALAGSLVAGGVLTLELELRANPIPVAGVAVRAEDGIPQIGVLDLEDPKAARLDPAVELSLLEVGPGVADAGLLEVVQALPGQDPSDPSDVLFMRGSTTELKLVLLDGIPVYTPFHVGGLLRSFEPAVLGRADLLVGGAPASYDGGLTHILDLRTRAPRRDRVRGSASFDLVSATAAVEAPLGTHGGLLLAGRGLHDLGREPLGGQRPYGYGDILVAAEVEPDQGHTLGATAFANGESILLDFPAGSSDADWNNRALSLRYDGVIGDAGLRFVVGGSRYRANLPLQPTPTTDDPRPDALLASAENERLRVLSEVAWGRSEARFRVGASYEDLETRFAATSVSGSRAVAAGGSTSIGGLFLDATRRLGPGVTLRAGLRGDVFGRSEARLGPRATLHWEVGPDALLSIAAGRYHQVARTPGQTIDTSIEAFAESGFEVDGLLPVATADHVVLSLDQTFSDQVSLGLSGFWKRFSGLEGLSSEAVLNSGIDVRILRAAESSTLWIGYGLSWFWSPLDLTGRTDDFAGRHLLSAGLSGPLFGRLRGETRIGYGAGLPSTSLPFGSAQALDAAPGGELSGAPQGLSAVPEIEPSFLRIDVELSALFLPTVQGRRWRVRPYVRLLNALDRRDALFYAYQPWRSQEVTPLAVRPIVPLLGVAFAF